MKSSHKKNNIGIIIAILLLFIALIGLIDIKNYSIYFFGFVFFTSGICIGLFVKGFGLIFLFSHGITGFYIIMASTLGALISSPIMSDPPFYIYPCLAVIVLIFLIAIILTIIFNLKDELRENKKFALVPLTLFTVAIIISLVLSRYAANKYGINTSLFLD